MNTYKEIDHITQLLGVITEPRHIQQHAFQNLDFTDLMDRAAHCTFEECLFLGCKLPESFIRSLDKTNLILPKLDAPYDIYRGFLYSAHSLYRGYDPDRPETLEDCFDTKVYRHFLTTGKTPTDIRETLCRYLHDHSMTNALKAYLSQYHEAQIVGIMGGHALLRTDPFYRKIVYLAKRLTELGFIMVSGGGGGAMEATHLGAWLAERTEEEVEDALQMLSVAPSWNDPAWLSTAFKVRKKYYQTHFDSVSIPTWLYGHELTTPFATYVAKYFDNSIREDTLLHISRGGLIFTPGSAGTLQEIFQAAFPNHYETFGYGSPMVFLGKHFWRREVPAYLLVEHLVNRGKYSDLLISITDDIEEIVTTLKTFRPKRKDS